MKRQPTRPSNRAGIAVRTQVRAGERLDLSNAQPEINLFDRTMFVVLDALQKPTNAVYDWVCAPNRKESNENSFGR